MKVLDLQCGYQHGFEGWFGSEDDFQGQLARNLVQCPVCGDSKVTKRLSAPRFNLGKGRDSSPAMQASQPVSEYPGHVGSGGIAGHASSWENASNGTRGNLPEARRNQLTGDSGLNPELAAAWMEVTKRILANTDDVGDQFAEEARKIHYGETKERSIRGRASPDETQALIEEGIAVMPLFVPEALKRPLQ